MTFSTDRQTAGARTRRARVAALATTALALGSLAACSTHTEGAAPAATPAADTTTCKDTVKVRVSVAPDLQRVVEEQARTVGRAACADYTVTAEQSANVTARGGAADQIPDLWIPDSPLWPNQVNLKLPGTYKVSDQAIASSPIVLAVPKAIVDSGKVPTGPQPMANMLAGAGPSLQIAKPQTSATSMLIMMAAWGNSKTVGDQINAGKSFVQVAHGGSSDEQLFNRAVPGAKEGPAVFPASEQAIAQFNNQHADAGLTALGAKEGLAGLKYVAATPAKLSGPVSAAVDALWARLRSPMAADILRTAGFRVEGKGTVNVPGLPQDQKVVLDSPSSDQIKQVATTMGRLAAPLRMLMVVDTSGSMLEPSGYGMSRIELVGKSVATALNFIPPNTQGGLWQFSNDEHHGGKDYEELAPIMPLSDDKGNTLPTALRLSNAFDAMAAKIGGGTGLYDTVWAAYQNAQAKANEQSSTVVVLLTDGRNEDDPDSISLDQLVANLRGAQNPAKPVKLVLGGIGPQADMGSLRAIAGASGGIAQVVSDQTSLVDLLIAGVL